MLLQMNNKVEKTDEILDLHGLFLPEALKVINMKIGQI